MKTGKAYTCLLLCFMCFAACYGQLNFEYTQGKFLLTGMVIDVETKKAIPSVNVRFGNTNKGTTCNNDGVFSLYVSRKDTLKFTSTGYMSKTIHIADLDSAHCCTITVEMVHDFVKLKPVNIYPFHNVDEFKKAFVEARDMHKVVIDGVTSGRWKGGESKAKFDNTISYFYELLKHKKSTADPNFKP